MWCAPVPCLYLWLLAALAPTCLSYIREPRSRFIIQTWQRAKITTFNLLVMLFQCSPGWLWPSLLLAHVQLGVDQEFSVASLQSFFPAGCPPGIILLVQDLACPYAECFQAYKRDQYLNVLKSLRERIALVTAPHPFLFTAQGLCSERKRENWTAQKLLWPFGQWKHQKEFNNIWSFKFSSVWEGRFGLFMAGLAINVFW